jgi:hypothetical protein
MEQTKDIDLKITENANILRFASYGSFIAFAGFLSFSALENPLKTEIYLSLAISVVLYATSLVQSKSNLASLGWIILGGSFIGWFVSSQSSSYVALALSILLLLAGYELTRFSFLIQPIVLDTGNLSQSSLLHLRKLMRNHSIVLLEVLSLSFVTSITVEYLSAGEIILSAPGLGIIVFASLAILVLVALTLLRSY